MVRRSALRARTSILPDYSDRFTDDTGFIITNAKVNDYFGVCLSFPVLRSESFARVRYFEMSPCFYRFFGAGLLPLSGDEGHLHSADCYCASISSVTILRIRSASSQELHVM